MAARVDWLRPALELLATNVDILPAVGGAMEDLERPDVDELEDMLVNRDVKEVTDFLESPTPELSNLYRATPPLFRDEKHLYRYFIDGSLRTYYLATGIEQNRAFPIELAQIGAAVMRRDDQGTVRPFEMRHRILLLLPKGQLGVSDTLWNSLKRLDTPNGFFQVIDTTERNANAPEEPTVENLRTRSGGIARNRMHRLEIELIQSTDNGRCQNNWLILDGAVKLDEFIRAPYLIGVAKSFRKDPEFQFGRTHRSRRDITNILIPCQEPEEAHFICAALNSSPSRFVVQSYIVLHPDPHILQRVRIPRYDPANPTHRELAALSGQAHAATAAGDTARVKEIEAEIDTLAARLWGLADAELKEIQQSLAELE